MLRMREDIHIEADGADTAMRSTVCVDLRNVGEAVERVLTALNGFSGKCPEDATDVYARCSEGQWRSPIGVVPHSAYAAARAVARTALNELCRKHHGVSIEERRSEEVRKQIATR